MQPLRIYSRQGCHLCDVLIEELLPIIRGRLATEICDIDSRPDWRAEYDTRVPVVEYAGAVVSEFPLDRPAITALLESLP